MQRLKVSNAACWLVLGAFVMEDKGLARNNQKNTGTAQFILAPSTATPTPAMRISG